MSKFLNAEKVVATQIGLLRREAIAARLVWTDAKVDPSFTPNDSVTLRLPAFVKANTRALRSGDPRSKSQLFERKVVVGIETDIYVDVALTDEMLSLDIVDFGAQVANPVNSAVVDQADQEIIDTIEGTTFHTVLTHDLSSDDVYNTIVDAATALDDARVPADGRTLAVGSAFKAALLKNKDFTRAYAFAGAEQVVRKGVIGEIANFEVVHLPGLNPNAAYAMHRTAFAMAQRAPIVPAGAPWGESRAYGGFALRSVRVFDPDRVEDRFITDSWIGVTPVLDDGFFDAYGKFEPTVEPGVTLGPALALASGEADDETIVAGSAHGFKAGDKVQFSALTGGAGLSTNTDYYVIAAGLTSTAFRVSATSGGAAVNFTTDITAGAVKLHAAPVMVRAVKIVVVP